MNHSHHSDEHDHPETFDEVIARGFPHDKLKLLAKTHRERVRERPAPRAARLARAAAPVAAAIRQDQAKLSRAKRTAFRNAITRLVEEGKYLELTQDHMDMSHTMHGSMGEAGLYRFLAWHRRYLLEMERELQRVDALLRPRATSKLGIPYWRWQDRFPGWLSGFLPATDPNTGLAPPPRKNASPPPKAKAADIDIIVNQFSIQSTGLTDENDYTKFTYGLKAGVCVQTGQDCPLTITATPGLAAS